MASVTVFVDEAVGGDLPPVCAKTGAETVDHLVSTVAVAGSGGLGAAWLLIFLGPVGWFALFVLALVRADGTLTVRLPYSDAAYAELASATRTKRTLGWSALAAFVAAAVLIGHSFTARAASVALTVVGTGLVVAWLAELVRVRRASVGVALDASRRWVTLSRVSDPFARAVERRDAERRDAERRIVGSPPVTSPR